MLVRLYAGFQPAWKRWTGPHNAVRVAGDRLVAVTPKVAEALSAFAAPAAFVSHTLGLWRLAMDFDVARNFVIEGGLFSHWQVWFALGALTQFAGAALARFAKTQDTAG